MAAQGGAVRRWIRLTAALTAAATLAGAPAVAQAGSGTAIPDTTSPFSPGVPISPQPTTTAATTPTVSQTTTSTSSSGLSSTGAIEVAVVAALVLGGIAIFIWRDARRRAPLRRTAAGDLAGMPGSSPRATKAPPKPRKLSPAERRRRKRGRAR